MNLVIETSWWFVLLCLLAGFLYAFILYRKEKRFTDLSAWLIRTMAVCRFFAVSILCFLLLSPLLRNITRTVEKPVLVIAQDNSESLTGGKDSAFYRNEYIRQLKDAIAEFGDKYEVKTYAFSSDMQELPSLDSLRFTGKQTDISSVFSQIKTRFSNRNVGAIILASDGLYNKGSNPVYSSKDVRVPVYTIALGDTTIKKDVLIRKVEHNRIAFLGNDFPLEVVVNAKKYRGATSTLTVSRGSTVLFTRSLTFNSDAFTETVPVLLKADAAGLQRYSVRISSQAGEVTLANNQRDVFIDVLDARQKILILADAPHPDVAAIKMSLEKNSNYEVESYTLDNFDKPLKKYNLVILHQLPGARSQSSPLFTQLSASEIPVWAISGAGTLLRSDLSYVSAVQKTNEVEPVLEKNFPLFTLSEELSAAIRDFPATVSPFGNYAADNSSTVLLYQRIGIVETKTPLLAFNTAGQTRQAVFFGEGLWKWRLQDFAANGSSQLFDELISKVVQYLSVKVDKSYFRVISKNNFLENEAVEMEAEVYNESYELINDPEVTLTLTNDKGKTFPFAFSKTSSAYRLNAGLLPVGEYKYEGRVKVGTKQYTQRGEFSVSALQVELTNTVADHQLLYSIAKSHQGEMLYPSQLAGLAEQLNAREDIRAVSYSEKKLSELINLKWIFFLVLSLLALEWFMRKRNGAY